MAQALSPAFDCFFDPPVLPARVHEAAMSGPLPRLIFDLDSFCKALRLMTRLFPAYHYPVKANPHPRLLQAAFEEGAGFDVCSPGELGRVLQAVPGLGPLSFTGLCPDEGFLRRLVELGAMVDLDSMEDIALWSASFGGRPVGVRVAPQDPTGYGGKFGIAGEQLAQARQTLQEAGCNLEGLHFHDGKVPRSGKSLGATFPPAEVLDAAQSLDLSRLRYINLGGGWPFNYSAGWDEQYPRRFAELLRGELAPLLGRAGFKGEIIVEPGSYVANQCGFWAMEIRAVRPHHTGKALAIADTVAPLFPPDLRRQATLLDKRGRPVPIGSRPMQKTKIVGCTNSPNDTICPTAVLPRPQPGDIAVVHNCGAYLPGLLVPFNLRKVPDQTVV